MLLKLPGMVEADPSTGQLTIRWTDIPQLPIGEIELSLYGGARALLATPAALWLLRSPSTLAPWSGTPAVVDSQSLADRLGSRRGRVPERALRPLPHCGNARQPGRGVERVQVDAHAPGGRTALRRLHREAARRALGKPGRRRALPGTAGIARRLSAVLAIGAASIGVGPGPDPFYLPEPGRQASEIYLTGPYQGAPFGLTIVVPAIAGPFDLGSVVVRAKIEVDPRTAQLTIASGAGGPTIEQGIPLDIRTLALSIDGADGKSNFIFNPTSCTPRSVTATIVSASGAAATASSPIPGRRLREPAVQAEAHGADPRTDEQGRRRLPAREDRLGTRPGGYRKGQDRSPQAAALAADDAPESLPRHRLRGRPGGLPGGVDRGYGDDRHADARGRAQRARLSRLQRR